MTSLIHSLASTSRWARLILCQSALCFSVAASAEAESILARDTPWFYGGDTSSKLTPNAETGTLEWSQGPKGPNNMVWANFPTTEVLGTVGGSVSFTFTVATDVVPPCPFRVGLFYDGGGTPVETDLASTAHANWAKCTGIAVMSNLLTGVAEGTIASERMPDGANPNLWSTGQGAFTETAGKPQSNPNLKPGSSYEASLTLTNTGAGIRADYVLGDTNASWVLPGENMNSLNLVSIFCGTKGGEDTSYALSFSNLKITATPPKP